MKQNIFFTILLLLGFLFLTTGCQKTNQLSCETLQNLAGTWHLDYGDQSLTFTTNYEYVDSVFSGPSGFNGPSVDTLGYVIKGRFELKNGFIVLSDLKYIYLRQLSVIYSFYYIFPTYQFGIIDNKLNMEEVGIFKPKGHTGSEIYGKWESNRIIIVYDTRQTPKFLSGNQIIVYDFNKNLNTYLIKYYNTYGIKQDSLTDGPFKYRFESPYLYYGTSAKVSGTIKDGVLITPDEIRTYFKVQ